MPKDLLQPSAERRSFLARLATAIAVVGGTMKAEMPLAAQAAAGAWQPARHDQDDWLDQIPGKHRLVIDSTSPSGFGSALLFASNFFLANQSGYGLTNTDIAVVIVARHNSTPFAFTGDMWAKYGALLARRSRFDDPKTNQPPAINVFNAPGYEAMTSMGTTIDKVVTLGLRFAVCQMATRNLAGVIADATPGAKNAEVYDELVSHLARNAHIVPAGIVALNRAQERGYAVAIAS